jgi:dTDP-4-dehydrorhamnose reductase
MRILVVGANGLLGSQVVATADDGTSVAGTYHSTEPSFDCDLAHLDIRDKDRFETILDRVAPDWVINCAAMTDVDGCEADEEQARAVNGDAPGVLAHYCKRSEIGFVHVSTDYVFAGQNREPYSEDDEPEPLQAYGRSKLAGERAVRTAADDALIVRPSFVYGIHGSTGQLQGFPTWVRDRLESGEEVPLYVDQRVSPTRAGKAASVILSLVAENTSGIYHIASRSCVTPYEFGSAIAEVRNTGPELLKRSSIDAVDRPAKRPRYTCLDVGRVEEELQHSLPSLKSDLVAIADAL